MKKLFTLLALIATIATFAQAPRGFNYQATVRNNSGQLLLNQDVLAKFNILQNSATGTIVYSETQTANTDDLGQISLVVGQGTSTTEPFSTINWGSGSYYLGIELNSGNGFVAMGTTQLLSVPYALYAEKSGSTIGNAGGFIHYIGELYGGGIVVSVWKNNGVEHGLIASLTDLSAGIPWTTIAFQQIEIGSAAKSFTDGLVNTNAIIAQAGVGTSYAAGLCKAYNADGFNDWYLPTINELEQCQYSRQIVSEILGDTNGFQRSNYWSSTESSVSSAWYQEPSPFSGYNDKANNYRVRAVRKF